MRVILGVEYEGTAYRGWQRQDHDAISTVQACLEYALASVADQTIQVTCAGRTDAGVHALGQVVHFDTDVSRSDYSWVFGANSNLPQDIRVLWAQHADENFHARFSALSRSYRYIIYNHSIRSAVWRNLATWYHRPLQAELMHEAAQYLIGEHDFTSFRGIDCQSKTPIRELKSISVRREGEFVILDVCANAFLHHMVRNIVGALLEIGSGKQSIEWIQKILAARDRTQAGVTALANGLYLMQVEYPEEFKIPARQANMDSLLIKS